MDRSPQQTLEYLARLAELNRKAVAKALGEKPKEPVNPYVQYANPSKS